MVKNSKGKSKEAAREELSIELRPHFDQLCEETIAWSKYYYGVQFISYAILMELIKSGWRKPESPATSGDGTV